MHLLMIVVALILAWSVRLCTPLSHIPWTTRWQRSLFSFVFSPLLLLMTAIAVMVMGCHGKMLGWQSGWYGYLFAIGFLIFTATSIIKLAFQGWQSIQTTNNYPQKTIEGKTVRLLETSFPYSAQVGFWNSKLVISQGLLDTLDKEHLSAVVAHEEAHTQYRDTFWFFILGWLGYISPWLPNTDELWQDLLLLREIRADRRASQQVDPLLIAESLVIVAQKIHTISENMTTGIMEVAFHDKAISGRINERIDALLSESKNPIDTSWKLSCILLTLAPLILIPFHG
ncbi:peptidase M56 BlaR1 [cyanobacterium endosymbiont of Rhopalodia gibberula]|uniref:M56 family metallopeptidase n=1 Tax=cyanobacterium endosymbiont of Rhopalodia gibberula TaxID=1763363 RepID=UPI000DC6EA2D|nr:M56 family metallopeptidase [cyanobacterium endosymbiont of Rhopalodia gibberula]BBA79989.1 peptidase M56 BlaR1 [cyanobacterium endosymbiont of Rhopalodia gibberula]